MRKEWDYFEKYMVLLGILTVASLIYSAVANADNKIILGGLIHHVVEVEGIKTTQFQQNVIVKVNRYNLLAGNNSIGEPIIGVGYDVPLGSTDHNFKIGTYYQDAKGFKDIGVVAPTFMPVLGLELNFYASDDDMIGLSQFVSPIITFTGLTIRF